MTTPDPAVEPILDPELPIVDAHHHLMKNEKVHYLLEDLLRDVYSGHNITHTVYIESRSMLNPALPEHLRPVGETEFANGVAAMSASGNFGPARACAAIIGYADLSRGAAAGEVLDAHTEVARARFRGIRQGSYWDASQAWHPYVTMRPPAGLLGDSAFRAGFKELVRRDLSFDAVLFHTQLAELVDLCQEFSSATVVLNHMGFPLGIGPYAGRRDEVFAQWRKAMSTLSGCENVLVKTGGCGIPLWGFGFESRPDRPSSEELADAWRPYVETTIEIFGARRCMMESNFPADRPSCDYVPLWNALKRITEGMSDPERQALFSGTATRAYRLSTP